MMQNSVNPSSPSRIVSNQNSLGNSNQNAFPFRINAVNASSSTSLSQQSPNVENVENVDNLQNEPPIISGINNNHLS